MKAQLRRCLLSILIGFALTLLIVAVADIPACSAIGTLLAPGLLAAAIVFPQGAEGDWPQTYLAVAVLIDAFFFSSAVLGCWTLVDRARRRRSVASRSR